MMSLDSVPNGRRPPTSSWSVSWQIQCRVIGALLMREVVTRYGRHNIGILWLVVEPMLFTLGVAGLWQVARMHSVSAIPVIGFAITGYSSVLLWRNASNRCAKAIEPNLSLMYHRHVKVLDIFAARILLELAGATGSFIILSLLFIGLGTLHQPADLLSVVAGWLLLCWFSAALGLIVGAVSERSEVFERVWHIVTSTWCIGCPSRRKTSCSGSRWCMGSNGCAMASLVRPSPPTSSHFISSSATLG